MERGGAGGSQSPPNNFREDGGEQQTLRPPIIHPHFSFNLYVKQLNADHKCTEMSCQMIIYVPYIFLEGIGRKILSCSWGGRVV